MSVESFIRAMPKVELDVYLEGAMRKDTLATIAEQNDVVENLKHFKNWLELLDRPDYPRLDELTRTVSGWLQQAEDLTRIVYELGVSLSKQNVRYAEVHINPLLYMDGGMTFEQLLSALNDGRDRSARGWRVQMGWILDIPRDQPRRSDDILRWATSAAARKGGVVGLGLSGKEDAQPIAQFERPFKAAQKKELPRVVQAGDVLQAEGILEAINQLEPARIVDGRGTADAPDIITLLTERKIGLNVCLARALCLGWVGSYAEYPLRQLYDDGVLVTITSGMPNLYKTTLVDEYLAIAEHNDFSPEELESIALNAVQASWLPDEEKQTMAATFAEEYAALRAEHLSEKTPSK